LTLGVVNEFRKHGIATMLLEEMIEKDSKIADKTILKYIYLHVVEYNKAALSFYYKNSFVMVKCKK